MSIVRFHISDHVPSFSTLTLTQHQEKQTHRPSFHR